MSFSVIAPMYMPIEAKDFREAVKNFVKLNHHMNITQMILTDQIKNMQANVRYYDLNGRSKAYINLIPTNATTMEGIIPMPIMGSPIIGFSSTDKNAKYPMPTIIGPSAIVGANNQVFNVKPVTTDGKPVGVMGPAIIGSFGTGSYPRTMMGGPLPNPMMGRPLFAFPSYPGVSVTPPNPATGDAGAPAAPAAPAASPAGARPMPPLID
jgi:hypothetical protein